MDLMDSAARWQLWRWRWWETQSLLACSLERTEIYYSGLRAQLLSPNLTSNIALRKVIQESGFSSSTFSCVCVCASVCAWSLQGSHNAVSHVSLKGRGKQYVTSKQVHRICPYPPTTHLHTSPFSFSMAHARTPPLCFTSLLPSHVHL
jgi:hypothetical protein